MSGTATSGAFRERIEAGPFKAWIEQELAKIELDDANLDRNGAGAVQRLADRLGVSDRVLRRYRSGERDSYAGSRGHRQLCGSKIEDFSRVRVEEMLDRAGVFFWEVYEDLAREEEIELEPDAYCDRCCEWITPINGCCPWHKTPYPVGDER